MGVWQNYKPVVAMLGLQFIYAVLSLSTRAVTLRGMSPTVFVVYRQAVATLVTAPVAYFSRRRTSTGATLGLRSFSLIFVTALIGLTLNQNLVVEGIYLTTSSVAMSMLNLVPAVTFVITAFFGLEKVNLRSLRSIAKIVGTVICVTAAISMVLLRGPKILNAEFLPFKSISGSGSEDWLLGSLCCFGSVFCWSLWLILQVPISACYPDHLSSTAWMCFLGTLQCAVLAFFLEKDLKAWIISSYADLAACLYAGVVASGIAFFIQAWCISKRGPLFSALFNPVLTVTTTILAALILHEEIYIGSLLGAIGVIIGLYIVLWGKAEEVAEVKEEIDPNLNNDQTSVVKIKMDEALDKTSSIHDLDEPLLSDKPTNIRE
ncbi:hypothetical protein SLA2020_231670 [Shorea laevis]